MDVLEFLQATFTDKRQIILAPSSNGNNSSLDSYSFETLEEVVHFKPQEESVPIIHEGNKQGYESLRADYLAANDTERPSFLVLIKDFVHQELFENISSNIHKGFASWTAADVGPLLLLNNTKVYSTDQSKCRAVDNRNRRNNKTQARSKLPSTQRELAPAGKPRIHISDSEPSDDDLPPSNSSFTETLKTYAQHTDSDLEDGRVAPILPEHAFNTSQMASSAPSSGPPSCALKSHRTKPGRRHSSVHPADNREKSAAKDRKKSAKKSRKSRKNRKSAKRARRHSKTSPSSASSASSSDDTTAPSEQVLPPPPFFLYLYYNYYLSTITTTYGFPPSVFGQF